MPLGKSNPEWVRLAGLEIKIFSREPNCIFKKYLKALCIETSSFLGSLQKFEGAAGEFRGALGSWHPLISSPGLACSQARFRNATALE